jgi:hypothetical protein
MGRLLVPDLIKGVANKGTRVWRSSYHSIKVNRRVNRGESTEEDSKLIDRKVWELRGGFIDLVDS